MNLISEELKSLENKDLMTLKASDLTLVINKMKIALGNAYPEITQL